MPVRIDIEPGSEYLLPFAKKKLEQLKCDTPDLLNKMIYVSTGESIFVQRGFVDLIRIRGSATLHNFAVPPDRGRYWSSQWSNFNAAPFFSFLGFPVGTVAPAPFTLVVKNHQIKAMFGVDVVTERLAAITRAIQTKHYDFAEGLVRCVDSDGSTVTDGALNCDEGFFVDLGMYSSRSFLDRLTTAVGTHARTLFHGAAPVVAVAFPEVDLSTYEFPVVQTLDSPRATFLPNGTQLLGVSWSGADTGAENSALLVGNASASASVLVGTRLTERRAGTHSSSTLTFVNDYKEQDIYAIATLTFAQNFYDVTSVNPGVSFQATHVANAGAPLIGGFPGDGQVTGYQIARSRRVKRRRGPDGWITVSDTDVPADATLLPFTKDGNSPANTITAPPTSGTAFSLHEDGAVVTQYAQTLYTSAQISYTINPIVTGYAGYTIPYGTYNPDFLGHGALLPTSVTTTLLVSDLALQRFTKGSLTVYSNTQLQVKALDASGNVLFTIPGSGGSPVSPAVPMVCNVNYPDAPDYTTFLTGARVDVSFPVFGLTTVARKAICPPTSPGGQYFVVYDATGNKVMYFTIVGGNTTAYTIAKFAYAAAIALNDPTLIAQKKAALLATVTIGGNTGLPTDFVVFGDLTGGGTSVLL